MKMGDINSIIGPTYPVGVSPVSVPQERYDELVRCANTLMTVKKLVDGLDAEDAVIAILTILGD